MKKLKILRIHESLKASDKLDGDLIRECTLSNIRGLKEPKLITNLPSPGPCGDLYRVIEIRNLQVIN